MRGAEEEGQGDTMLSTEPNTGLDPTPWDHDLSQKSRVGCLTSWATQVPAALYLKIKTKDLFKARRKGGYPSNVLLRKRTYIFTIIS